MSMQEETNCTKTACDLPQGLCANICCCIVEEMLHELFILRKISNNVKKGNLDGSSKETLSGKNIKTPGSQITETMKHNLTTFEKNYDFIEKILQKLYEELETNGSYENFVEVVEALHKSKTEENNLKEETLKMQTELMKLECTLYQEEKFYHTKIAECMANIGNIKDEIEDFSVESEIKTDYIEKWQNSKMEMTEIFLKGKEQEKINELKRIEGDIYKETRVHQEIVAAYNEMEKDFNNDIDKWEEKYNKDYEELETRIQAMKDKREKQTEATRILKETYLKREKEINDYKIYKIQQEEKKLELQKRHDAATKIQAWWRGTMVRKGFGKFRKKKDKKGKKKGLEKQEKK